MQINRVLAGFHSPSDHLWKPIFTGLSKFQCIPTPHPISLWRLGNFLRFVARRMVVVGANNRSISTTISSCYNGKNRRISRWRPIFRKNSTQFFALLHSYSFFCRARFLFKSCYKLYEKKDNQKMYISIFKNGERNVSFPNYQILLCRFFSIINRSDSFVMKLLVEFLVGTSMEIGRNSWNTLYFFSRPSDSRITKARDKK